MRRDDLYFNDILEAADHIAVFLRETDFEAFLKSELILSAVVQKLLMIGEAHLPGVHRALSAIPWASPNAR